METAICTTIKSISRGEWEACRSSRAGGDPFLSYDFFFLLETSNSVGPKTGWIPSYIIFKEKNIDAGYYDLQKPATSNDLRTAINNTEISVDGILHNVSDFLIFNTTCN